MFYSLLRSFVLFCLNQYFHEVVTRGEGPVEDGPVLIVSNHPNVMIDGLLIIRSFERKICALAKGALFKGPQAYLLRALNLVPVYRREDDPAMTSQNEGTFHEVFRRFDDGEAILIFPEGKNSDPRNITELKTGAARIALQYQALHDFSSPFVIQPIGLTYLDRKRFRGSVTVKIGEPLLITGYKQQYQENEAQAVHALTEDIRTALRGLTVEIHDETKRSLVDKIAKLYRSAGMGGDDLKRLQRITEMVEEHADRIPGKPKELEKRLNYYLELSSSLMLDGSSKIDTKERWLYSMVLIPIVMFGLIVNYPPYRAITFLAEKYSSEFPGQRGSWGFGLGVILFPLWFLFICLLTFYLFGSVVDSVILFCILVFSGYLLNTQFQTVALFFFKNIWPARRSPLEVLRKMRVELLEELEAIREELLREEPDKN